MAGGRHSADESFYDNDYETLENAKQSVNYVKILIIIGILITIIGIGFGIFKYVTNKNSSENNNIPVTSAVDEIPSQLEGYKVLGKLIIDKIDFDQYILDSTEDKALEKGIVKLYGGTLNNYGNLCLAGHNYDNMFGKLTELEKGDKFILIDKDSEKITYEIKDIFSVEPDNLECLLQDEDKVEITLITCENGSTSRLIVKAEEVNES